MANALKISNGLILDFSVPAGGIGDAFLAIDTNGALTEYSSIPVNRFVAQTASRAAAFDGSGFLTPSAVTAVEQGYSSGVTSSIQSQLNSKQATINLTINRAVVSDGAGALAVSLTTATEIGYSSGVTSAIQTQINTKQATITGGATTIVSSNLTVNRALVSDGSGKVAVSTVTATELGYSSGVTSALQAQINAKLTVTVTTPASGDVITYNGSAWVNSASAAQGVPVGGTAGQYLNKINSTNYNTQWSTLVLSKITNVTATAAEVNLLSGVTTSTVQLNYLNSVSSNIQSQLNSKLPLALAQNSLWVGNTSNIAVQLGPGISGYVLTSVGGVPTWQPSAGGGGGISSGGTSTDDAIVRWDGTLGAVVQDSVVGVSDTGIMTGATWNSNIIDGQYGGTGVANTGLTITLGGNLVTSGAFSTTLTVTGTTALTLPTSGTLLVDGTNILTQNMTIDGAFNVRWGDTTVPLGIFDVVAGNAGYTQFSKILANIAAINLTHIDPSLGTSAEILLDATGVHIAGGPGGLSGTQITRLDLTGTTALFTDTRVSKRGIEYNATGYVTQLHSLADKEYVDAHSGITNTAANNELMMSNGTNAIPSGIFADAAGNINMGTSLSGASRTIAPTGSAANIGINVNVKGAGAVKLLSGALSFSLTAGAPVFNSIGTSTLSIIGSLGSSGDGYDTYISGGLGPLDFNGGNLYLSGGIATTSGPPTIGVIGNIGLGTTSGTFGGGAGVIFVSNASVNPTTNPTAGGIMFVKSSDNKPYWRTPAGVETLMLGGTGWALTGTSTLTGVATITSNAANQHIFNGTWTAAAAADNHITFGGTITAASGLGATGYVFNPSLAAVGTSGVHVGVDIAPTFSGGTTPVNIAARFKNAGVIIGSASAFEIPASPEFLLVRNDNASSGTGIVVRNGIAGAAAQGFISVRAQTCILDIGATSASFTPSGLKFASVTYLLSNCPINIGTSGSNNASIWTNSLKRVDVDGVGRVIFTEGTTAATVTFITFTQAVHTGGSPTGLLFTGGAHTSLTASVEALAVNLNTSATVQYATGAQALLRNVLVQAPTISFVGASAVADNATFTISGAPKAGTNATQTNTHGLLIQPGAVTSAGSAFGATINAPTGGTLNYAMQTIGGTTLFATSVTGYASIRLPHGTAPTSPVNGDFWTTTASAFARINGVTVDLGAGGSIGPLTTGTMPYATGLGTIGDSEITRASANSYVLTKSINGQTSFTVFNPSTGNANSSVLIVTAENGGVTGALQVNGSSCATNPSVVTLSNSAGHIYLLANGGNVGVNIATPSTTFQVRGLSSVSIGATASTYGKVGGMISDHFVDAGNTTTTETDLYTDTTPASTLGTNGDKLCAEYGGTFVSSATATRQIRLYFGGSVIFDSGTLTVSLSSQWTVYLAIIRVSATVVRYMVSMTTEGAALAAYTSAGELTGLTLSTTNILKITGQAASTGAATNDIVGKLGYVEWKPAA